MFLAIDIGNTSTTVGVLSEGRWRTVRRDTTTLLSDEVVLGLLQELGGTHATIARVGIASVVPAVDEPLVKILSRVVEQTPIFLTVANYPHPIRYPLPHEIGADRLADAAGALAKFTPPLIIVDFGTATTFDYLDADGAYCGGPIMPGVLLSKRALTDAAAKLPPIEFATTNRLIPQTTVEAMQSGLFHGTIGAVDHILTTLIEEVGGAPTLIATGGLATAVVPALQHRLNLEPLLTLEGMAATLQGAG